MTTSKKASGPKTAAGKRRVRFNALSHGFFSKELVVREPDKAEFEALEKGIRTQLNPATALQHLAAERVVSAAWRYKLALRMEAIRLKPQLDGQQDESASKTADANSEPPRWFTSSRRNLNIATRLLQDLRNHVRENGELHLADHK